MNDKCAAGTGRFLEMMARTMEMSLDQMSECGLEFKEDITISSMCTVFAESEVVSLIAQNKATDDIVHGLNKAVAVKTAALTRRVGGEEKYHDDRWRIQEQRSGKNSGRKAWNKAGDQ